MNAREYHRAYTSLLREVDARCQRYYHERLTDVVNDLRLHHIEIRPDPSAEELLSVISRNRILDFTTAAPMVELREAIDRLMRGTFGLCVDCGEGIPSETLEQHPTAKLCGRCNKQKVVGFNLSRPAENRL